MHKPHMKRTLIPTHTQEALLEVPESGMGYHKVDIILKDGTILKEQIIVNGTHWFQENKFNFKTQDIENIQSTQT